MSKKTKRNLLIFGVSAVLILVGGKLEGCWYMESLNKFTLNDACKIKKGMNIYAAWDILGRPAEYENYNFSNVMSAQYRCESLFIEIWYTPDAGKITEVFYGKGRSKTLTESGVCSNMSNVE